MIGGKMGLTSYGIAATYDRLAQRADARSR